MSSNNVARGPTPPPVYDISHPPMTSRTSLKPYLTLPYRISLAWLAYPILSLLFVAFRLQLSAASAQDAVGDAKSSLLTSCSAAQQAATGISSMPRFMADATNRQISDAVNATLNGSREALILSLTIIEGLIEFIIDIYRSTFLCFLELVVRGGLAIIIGAVQEITNFLQSTLGGIRTTIQNDVSSANSAIQTAIDGINKVNPFADIKAPQLSIPSLDSLNNVTIPTDFVTSLQTLNASIPSLDDLRDKIDSIIDIPFSALKKEINDTFLGLSFNATSLPVPQQNALTFCNDLDTSIVDNLGRDLLNTARIGVILIIVLAVALIIANSLFEWYQWRCLMRHFDYTREAWMSDPTLHHTINTNGAVPRVELTNHNMLMLEAESAHPLLTRIVNRLSAKLRLSQTSHINLQFFFRYIFYPPALACLIIGVFGILSVQIQLAAVGPIQARYSSQVASSVTDFSNTIAVSVNANMQNQSTAYAQAVNAQVNDIQSQVNEDLFGWVNGTTTTLNDTLSGFYTEVQNAVTTVFGNTILEAPAQEFIRCIIGTKVEAVENALTFLHDNLHIDMPTVNDSVLLLSSDQVDEVTRPVALAAVGNGDGSDGSDSLVGRLVSRYVAALEKERLMFLMFIGLWFFVVLIAIGIIVYHTWGKRMGFLFGRRRWHRKQREHFSTIVVPWESRSQDNNAPHDGLNSSFTPSVEKKGGFLTNLRLSPTLRSRNPPSAPLPPVLNIKSEKSWDSIIEETAPQQSETTQPKISGPRKLMAIGRQALGREVLVPDSDRSMAVSHPAFEPPQEQVSWRTRLRGFLNSKRHDMDDHLPNVAPQLPPISRPRPNLSISTDNIFTQVERSRLPTVEQAPPTPTPGLNSAWSMSPGTPQRPPFPWIAPAIAPTAPLRPRAGLGLPANPKPVARHVPMSVNSTYGPSAVKVTAQAPLYHAFERRVPSTPRSPSPPLSPLRASRPPPSHGSLPMMASLATPTRSLTSGLSRASPHAENPFATPFDDEARVVKSPRTPGFGQNPFSPHAF